jgi:mono/diheme cytochrome c family protein
VARRRPADRRKQQKSGTRKVKRLFRYLIGLIALITVAVGGFFAFAASVPAIDPIAPPDRASFPADLVETGETLAAIGDCTACHTRESGGQEYAGGRALPTPFGTIYSTNITPDPETGIGAWSEAAFMRALREGIARDGGYLYPAFPYDHFTKATDEDIRAVYAYLMTREPVSATAPENELPFPFNIRLLMAGWNLLFLDQGAHQPDPAKDEEWNRGAYLVEGLGHCGSCHSPRNLLGAEDSGRRYAGGEAEFWHAPALNQETPALAGWTADALVNYLIDGWDGDHGIAAGPMTPVVEGVSRLSEDDVYAIADYVMSLIGEQPADKAEKAKAFAAEREFGGTAAPAPAAAADTAEARGEATFARVCANCHRSGGQTVPLALTSTVAGTDPRNVIHIVMNGIQPPSGVPEKSMPRFGPTLSDEEIADLLAFLRVRFTDRPAWNDVPARIGEARAPAE